MMHYRKILLRGVALLWLCSCTAAAQQSAPSAAANLFDLEFSGGTPAEFVAAVEKASGQPLNLIIPEAGREVQIPPFKVKQVSIESLLPSLRHETVQIRVVQNVAGGLQYLSSGYQFIKRAGPNSEAENQVWVLKVDAPEPAPPPTVSVEPVNVAQLLEHYTIDDLSTAIQLAWESSQDEMLVPEIKFHKETSLLIVSGTDRHIQLMKHVLSELSREATDAVDAPGSAPGE